MIRVPIFNVITSFMDFDLLLRTKYAVTRVTLEVGLFLGKIWTKRGNSDILEKND